MEWVYVILTVIVAGFAYRLRCTHQAVYGLTEIIAALALIYFAFFPHGPVLLAVSGGGLWDTVASYTLNLVAGIYVFVRGMDNIVTGLRE